MKKSIMVLAVVAWANAVRAFYPIGSTWPDGNVSLNLRLETSQPSEASLQDGSTSWDQVAQAAIAKWNANVVTTKLVGVSNSTAQVGIQNGVNNVYWSASVLGETLDPYVLGVTIISTTTSDTTATAETDVVFNPNAYGGWDSYRGALSTNGRNDFRRVAIHEFGHVLGLDHPDAHGESVVSVMNSVESDTDDLTDDDVQGAIYLYGAKAAPVFVRQPSDLKTNIGGTAVNFDVDVRGRGPIFYQWLHNGTNPTAGATFVPGQTRYGYAKVQGIVDDVGPYTLVVANPWGYTESVPAEVATYDGLRAMPTDQVANAGDTVTFRVEVAEGTAAMYVWTAGGAPLAETGPVLTLTNVQAADEGGYTVTVTIGSHVYTKTFFLQMPLCIVSQPQSQNVDVGAEVTLTVQAEGTAKFSSPTDLALDAAGNLYVADLIQQAGTSDWVQSIRKITPAGLVTTVSQGATGIHIARAPNGYIYFPDESGLGIMVGDGAVMNIPAGWDSAGVVAVDKQGNICATGFSGAVIDRFAANTTMAQSFVGGGGSNQLDGKGLNARFGTIQGLAFSPDGTLYAADVANNGMSGYALIRKIASDGTVTTLAGGSAAPYHMVDGTGAAAGFVAPSGLASDADGNLIVAEGSAIRKVTTAGVVTTLAGGATTGYADGVGSSARFSGSTGGVVVAADGTIYVVDVRNFVIRRIATDGTVSTYAGVPGVSGSDDGAVMRYQWQLNGADIPNATEASLKLTNFQVANDGVYTVRLTSSLGTLVSAPATVGVRPTIVTQPASQTVAIGGAATLTVGATSASGGALTYQWQVNGADIPGATGATLVVSEDQLQSGGGYYSVKVFDGATYTVSQAVTVTPGLMLATQPAATQSYQDGACIALAVFATSAEEPTFGNAAGVATDGQGNLYVADQGYNTIRKIAPSGTVTTLAGKTNVAGGSDGTGTEAQFNGPSGLVLGPDGNLYVACQTNVRKVTPAGVVTTVAGASDTGGAVDGSATTARFGRLANLTCDATGNLYVADAGNHTIRQIAPDGTVSTYAGATGVAGYADGARSEARFDSPSGLAIDGAGNLFVTDGYCVRKIAPGGTVSTVAGQYQQYGRVDGLAGAAQFQSPTGVAIDASGAVLVLDADLVRRITADGWVATIGGILRPSSGSVLLGGSAFGLAIDGAGKMYVGASRNVRIITPDGHYGLYAGNTAYDTSPRDGALTHYQWYCNGAPIAGATNNIHLIRNFQAADAGQYTVTVSNSYGSVTASTQLTDIASAPWIVAFDSTTQSIPVGGTETFSVIGGGTGDLSYQWLKNGVAIPGATTPGLTIANAQAGDQAYYAVAVTSALGAVTSTAFALNVVNAAAPAITMQPYGYGNHTSGEPLYLTVTASGASALSFQWVKDGVDILGATSASLSLSHAVAGDSGTYTVRITDAGGSIVSVAVPVTIPAAQLPVFTLQPASATVLTGRTVTLQCWATSAAGIVNFQWQKDGVDIPGANLSSYNIDNAAASDQGVYTVRAATDAGAVTSQPAIVTVPTVGSFAGSYFGTFDESGGQWALHLSPDGTGVLIAYIDSNLGVTMQRVKVAADGSLSSSDGSTVVAAAAEQGDTSATAPRQLTTGQSYSLTGTIAAGVFQGAMSFGSNSTKETMYGELDTGAGNFTPDFYDAYALGSVDASTYAVVGPSGQALFVVATPAALDAYAITLGADGKATATLTGGAQLALTIDAANRTLAGTLTQPGLASALTLQARADGAAPASHLINISSRLYCGTGNDVAIGGFVIVGTGTKQVLIRAVGPTLTKHGIGTTEVLADPTITLHQGTSVLAANDNWEDNANAADIATVGGQIGAGALDPTDTKSSALLLPLAPGAYSFVVSGKNATTGIVLVEVYDADPANTNAGFADISSRGYATTGNGVAIGGFVITGGGPKRVLLRGVGPTLDTLGLNYADVLADPQITLHLGAATVAANDNAYRSANWQEIVDTGARIGATPMAAPVDAQSSALLLYLAPGAYSFIASGKSSTSGIVLVEIYDAD